ncbi:MAG: hypothetical protein P8012_16215 [Desulfobacterales bacterium]
MNGTNGNGNGNGIATLQNGDGYQIQKFEPRQPAPDFVGNMVTMALGKIDEMHRLATTLLKSNFLPTTIRTPEQAVTVMLKGMELGIPFMEALENISIVKGKPVVQGNVLLAKIAQAGGRYKILREDVTGCEIIFSRRGWDDYKASFTIEDAKRAGLAGRDVWRQYPSTMLKWRAVSKGARTLFPDVTGGMYIPEELASKMDSKASQSAPRKEPDKVVDRDKPTAEKEPQILKQTEMSLEQRAEQTFRNQQKENEKKDEKPAEVNMTDKIKEALIEDTADEAAKAGFIKAMNGLKKRLEAIDINKATIALYEVVTSFEYEKLEDFKFRSDMERAYRTFKHAVELIESGIKA